MKPEGYEKKRHALMAEMEKAEALDIELEKRFMDLAGDIVFSMLHKDDNFFGSFMVQVDRGIDCTINTGAGIRVGLSGISFMFNPRIMATLPLPQAKAEIRHQIYHLVSGHIGRKRTLRGSYDNRILNLAADVAIDQYIEDLPEWEPTLGSVSEMIGRKLPKGLSMELYAEMIKDALSEERKNLESTEEDENPSPGQSEQEPPESGEDTSEDGDAGEDHTAEREEHDEDSCHAIWEMSEDAALEANEDMVRRILENSLRGEIPEGLEEAVDRLNRNPEMSWQKILRKLVGTLPAPYRKTVTRKNRRQPERLDLRGRLPRYETELIVAVDTSGSMDSVDLRKALNEIFEILKLTRHSVTMIECDAKIQRAYQIRRPSELKTILKGRGGTLYSPVFRYIREHDLRNALLVYFTDGGGEEVLEEKPLNKNTFWVLTGNREMSLKDPPGRISRLSVKE